MERRSGRGVKRRVRIGALRGKRPGEALGRGCGRRRSEHAAPAGAVADVVAHAHEGAAELVATPTAARALMWDLKPRLRYRMQLTTDGHSPYLEAVEEALGAGIDYAWIVKNYSEKGKDEQPDGTDFFSKYRVGGQP